MKVVSVSLMRNEADIVEAFVRYHMQFLDGMVIVDHRSSDGSAEILRRLQGEGLRIILQRNDRLDYNQSRMTNDAARSCLLHFGADWVIPLDIDEFLVPRATGGTWDELALMPQDRPAHVMWKTYVPTCSDDRSEPNVIKRIDHRLQTENRTFTKTIVPAGLLKNKRYSLSEGNHDLIDTRKDLKVPGDTLNQFFLAHFPVRSTEQIMAKVLVGRLTRLSRFNAVPGNSYQFEKLYESFKHNREINCEDLETIAAEYTNIIGETGSYSLVHYPINSEFTGFRLLYTSGFECDPIGTALVVSEEIAAELGKIRNRTVRNKYRKLRNSINGMIESFYNKLKLLERNIRRNYGYPLMKLLKLK